MENKKYQLPREFATKWINELRNVNHTQIRGVLRRYESNGYCYCATGLGYLANGFEFANNTEIFINNEATSAFDYNLPIPNKLFHAIINLNDGDRKTFAEIADFIEENVEFI